MEVKVGDYIYCKGQLHQIQEIYSVHYYEGGLEAGWFIEFKAKNGYGYWKQYIDGGKLLREIKED